MSVADVLRRHEEPWHRAVHHPFLDQVRDGSLPDPAFDTWLVQDHHFVTDLERFQQRLLERAPAHARRVLGDGLAALRDELAWFEGIAERRGLDLTSPRRPATERARELMVRLDAADVSTALLGLWAIERAYLDAWTYASPGAAHLREYVEHWTTPEFGAYVDGLARACDASPVAGDDTFLEVAEMERAFWVMASEVSRTS
ncbi:hypothetical protein GCM10011519_21140 [Marmoricola endophyticus]|uniref:Thiaminase-2/PQQC domain-containing protein n=1 Tax=Marmoricola endophyticus TaxID=2040280 RepID=A0A917F468_9ACTN|nr:TenA family transcriptional regulator [Marmoricola endophyticus]GGF46916.1 hypothetical protein GCM10011519_21140 [Marmoricola endophyticus]